MRIAIYTRKSVYVENSESIETQINLCKTYFKGDNDYEIFEDEGYSGKNTNRPAFKRLILECKMNKFDALICYRLDRISRNVADFSSTLELLQKYNVTFISIKEQFDTSTPMGRAMIYIASVFAQLERETIAERVKDNMLQLAKKGYYTGGTVPKGCKIIKENKKSLLQIIDSDLIHLYLNSYLDNGSLFLGYKFLKEKGITISREGYRKVLRNPIYVKSSKEVTNYLKSKGYEVIGKVDNKSGYMTYGKITNTPIAIVGKHIGVLDSNIWLKVQMQLDKRKEQFKNTSEVNFLSSVLKCPYCGGYYQLSQSNKVRYYVCQNRINRTKTGIDKSKEKCKNKKYIKADLLEEKISQFLKQLENKDIFKKLFSDPKEGRESNILILEKQLNKNNNVINGLVEKVALLSTEASKVFIEKIEELTQRNNEIKNKIEIEKLLEMQKKANDNSSEFIYNKIIEFNKLKSTKEKNRILKLIFTNLQYDPYKNKITI
ncbi:recombinase family protein [Clostridium botulinum]|nr:recombinase family protein [Clostridium botulinum]